MENYYVFLKNDRVENVVVFENQDDEFATQVALAQNYDSAVFVADKKPAKWSTYDGKKFTNPTDEFLISIKIKNLPVEVKDESIS